MGLEVAGMRIWSARTSCEHSVQVWEGGVDTMSICVNGAWRELR